MSIQNFNVWKNEIADMPERVNGEWVDLETGIAYDPNVVYQIAEKSRKARWRPSERVKKSRNIARFYGAPALKGSQKQKTWGEKIRAEVLSSDAITDEQKIEFLNAADFLNNAKFWIENRNVEHKLFTYDVLAKEYKALMSLVDKHYDTFVRTSPTHKRNQARKEIKDLIAKNNFSFEFNLPHFEV